MKTLFYLFLLGFVVLIIATIWNDVTCADDCFNARVYPTRAQCEWVCSHRSAARR